MLVSKKCQGFTGEKPVKGHCVYRRVDGRLRAVRELKKVAAMLLQDLPGPPSPLLELLAGRVAFKLIRVASYEAFVLNGNTPSPDAERTYLTLANQIRQDIETLYRLGKERLATNQTPSLEEYLRRLRDAGKLVDLSPSLEATDDPDGSLT